MACQRRLGEDTAVQEVCLWRTVLCCLNRAQGQLLEIARILAAVMHAAPAPAPHRTAQLPPG
jgi:hypothetical protein